MRASILVGTFIVCCGFSRAGASSAPAGVTSFSYAYVEASTAVSVLNYRIPGKIDPVCSPPPTAITYELYVAGVVEAEMGTVKEAAKAEAVVALTNLINKGGVTIGGVAGGCSPNNGPQFYKCSGSKKMSSSPCIAS